jgi:Mg2+/Co2+ transporter CorC
MTGEIPEKNQIIRHGNFKFRIESADRRRIKEIRVDINTDDSEINKD